MKKILSLFLLLFSINGYCEWTKVKEDDELTRYVDFSSVKRNGNFVRVWEQSKFKLPQSSSYGNYQSSNLLTEYDCKEDKFRILSLIQYSELTGGNIVFQRQQPTDWVYSPPNSYVSSLSKIICKSK